MKHFVLSLFITISLSVVYSQQNILFQDKFTDNHNFWYLFDNEGASAEIRSNSLVLKHKYKSGERRFIRSVFLDVKKDFYIEAEMKQVLGVHDAGYGIVWGTEDWKNNYCFVVASSGYYKIYGYENEEEFILNERRVETLVNPAGTANILAVEKKENKLNFYINKKQVYTTDFKRFFGVSTGFVLGRDMTVYVNSFTIKHPPVQINLVEKAITNYPKEKLDEQINSQYMEIAPVISPDGKTLYVARKDHTDNTGYNRLHDIWYSNLDDKGNWSELINIGKPLNNDSNNLAISVTPDGNSLLLEGVYDSNGNYISDQGISVSHRTKTGWSIPEKVIIKNFYNRNEFESYCPTANRQAMILSVERDDTYGKKDLYVSFRLSDGTFSEPKNLGPGINTYDNEGTPFMAADNVTLYFYSYGHPGYGSADIFVSKRLDNSWTKWSEPKNLGKPINSQYWDTYFTISALGDYAYLVSMESYFGDNYDIYRIKLPQSARPEPVVLLYGKVLDSKTNQPIGALIIYENIETEEIAGYAESDPLTGTYKAVLPYGFHYGIRANAENYFSVNENIDLEETKVYTEIEKNLLLSPFEVGQVVVLNNIFFDRGKYNLKPKSNAELNRIADFLLTNKTVEIEIGGHTEINHADPVLSQNRANTVKEYLVKKGVNESRISAAGYANTKPVTRDLALNQLNRRVEFKILKK